MAKALIVAIVIAVLGFIPLMGLPGMLAIVAAQPTTNLFYGPLAWEAWNSGLGDRAWPLAIILNFVWPVLIPLGYFVVTRVYPESPFFSPGSILTFSAILVAGLVLIGQAAIVLSGTVHRLTRQELVAFSAKSGKLEVLKKNYKPGDLAQLERDPLVDAIFSRRTKVAEYLIRQRDFIDGYMPPQPQNSIQFATPLHTAVNIGSVELVRILLEKGADPDRSAEGGQPPLHALSWDPDGDGEVLKLLQKHGADFRRVDNEGNTALIAMIRNVHNHWPEMVEYARIMIDAGVEPGHVNNKGRTALSYAEENFHSYMVEFLKSKEL